MSAPRRKRAKPWRKHDLHEGEVIVRSSDFGASVTIGLQYAHVLSVSVSPIPHPRQPLRHDWVQLQVKLYDSQGSPLGSDAVLGQRMPQLAWAFLNTRTGEMTQAKPYTEEEGDAPEPTVERPGIQS